MHSGKTQMNKAKLQVGNNTFYFPKHCQCIVEVYNTIIAESPSDKNNTIQVSKCDLIKI